MDCFSITIIDSNFYNFGQLKAPINDPILVDDLLLLKFSGAVLDFDNFMGKVTIQGSEFKNNIVSYSTCDSMKIID